ncbi:DNA replication licensing factor MCM9, partial [Stegodyphus mimosarum]
MVSSYILNGKNILAGTNTDSVWSLTKMKNYFSLIRYINPRITPECEKVLQTYYKRQRALEGRSAARTTPRLLQSLIRLAEGHARLMFRDEVLVIDAVYAIILMESSMLSFSILEGMSPLHTTFPNSPEAEFEDRARTILRILQLDELLSISKNYKQFYQDFNVKRLLLKISSVFNSTKLSYLFDRNNEEDITKSTGIYNESCSAYFDTDHIDRYSAVNADFNFKSVKSLKGDELHCTVEQETKNVNENLHNSSLLDKIKENKSLFAFENGKKCKNLHKNAGVAQNS